MALRFVLDRSPAARAQAFWAVEPSLQVALRSLATLGGNPAPPKVNHDRRKLSLSPAELIKEKRELSRRSWKNFGRKRAEVPNPFAPPLPWPEVDENAEKIEVRRVSQKFTNVHYSPLRMNVVAKLLRRQTVPEALAQAFLTPKKGGQAATALIEACAGIAEDKYSLPHEALKVEHLIVNQGPGTKRVKFMGRGRTGIKFIRTSHLNLTLAEIDFDANIKSAVNAPDAHKWAQLKEEAIEATEALIERKNMIKAEQKTASAAEKTA